MSFIQSVFYRENGSTVHIYYTNILYHFVTTPTQEEDPQQRLLLEIIRDDSLRRHEREQRDAAEYCILTAAKLMAPLIEGNFAAGFDWCIECVRGSAYAELASELEIAKAATFLKEKEFQKVGCCIRVRLAGRRLC